MNLMKLKCKSECWSDIKVTLRGNIVILDQNDDMVILKTDQARQLRDLLNFNFPQETK